MIDGRLGARLTLGHSSTSVGGALTAAACAGCQSTRLSPPPTVSNLNGPAPAGGGANLKLELGGLRKGQFWRPAPLKTLDQVSRLIDPARPVAGLTWGSAFNEGLADE